MVQCYQKTLANNMEENLEKRGATLLHIAGVLVIMAAFAKASLQHLEISSDALLYVPVEEMYPQLDAPWAQSP